MTTWIWWALGALTVFGAVLGTLLFWVGRAAFNKLVGDEARARVDDLPAVILKVALRRLPEEVREFYRVDWESNLLAALHDSTVRYPVTRAFKSLGFAWSLALSTRRIRRELVGGRPLLARVALGIWRGMGDPDFIDMMALAHALAAGAPPPGAMFRAACDQAALREAIAAADSGQAA